MRQIKTSQMLRCLQTHVIRPFTAVGLTVTLHILCKVATDYLLLLLCKLFGLFRAEAGRYYPEVGAGCCVLGSKSAFLAHRQASILNMLLWLFVILRVRGACDCLQIVISGRLLQLNETGLFMSSCGVRPFGHIGSTWSRVTHLACIAKPGRPL